MNNKIGVFSNLALQLSKLDSINFHYDEYFNDLGSTYDLGIIVLLQGIKPIRSKELLIHFLKNNKSKKLIFVTDDPVLVGQIIKYQDVDTQIVDCSFLLQDKNLSLINLKRFQNPFSSTGLTLFDEFLKVIIDSCKYPSIKVICCDFDLTIWGGILGDFSTYQSLYLKHSDQRHLYIQRLLILLKELGVLLVLTTKNNKDDVFDFFHQNPEMPIKIDDFILVYANWNQKLENIKDAAQKLNLGLDSFVFIDDSDLEIELVQSQKEIQTIKFPTAGGLEIIKVLFEGNTRIQSIQLKELNNKTTRYKEEFKRSFNLERLDKGEKEENLDPFQLLKIQLEFNDFNINQTRISEMSEKTNQFNFNKQYLSVSGIEELEKNGDVFTTCEATDKYGDYGIIGYAHVRGNRILNFVMSCRALSRGIEIKFIEHILQKNPKIEEIIFKRTKRNKPAENFLKNLLDINIKVVELDE